MRIELILALSILALLCLPAPGQQETAEYWLGKGAPEYGNESFEEALKSFDNIGQVMLQNNLFALDMYQELAAGDENIFFSPWSLNSALSMTYEGARGQTAEEMKTVLHLPENEINRRQSFSIRSKNQCP